MSKKQLLLLIISIMLSFGGIAGLFLLPFSPLYQEPKAKSISSDAPVKISTVRGEVIEYNDTTLKLLSENKEYAFPAASISQVYKLVTGTVEGGDAQTIDVDKSELKIGQEIFVIAERNLSWIRAVYILNDE